MVRGILGVVVAGVLLSLSGIANAQPCVPEQCNGLDDDCDGVVDNDAECPGESTCRDGVCSLPCGGGTFPCPHGFICVNGWCEPDPCDPVACEAKGWICKDGVCIDPCVGVTCGLHEACIKGLCVDVSCNNPEYACPEDQICVDGVCQPDPCSDVDCGPNSECVDGACVWRCDAADCLSGDGPVEDPGLTHRSGCTCDIGSANSRSFPGLLLLLALLGIACRLGR